MSVEIDQPELVRSDLAVEDRPNDSVGERLRRAREAQELTQEDLARRLRLSVRTLVDIESDDYRHCQALIYVQGYLRGYARAVGLPEQEILDQFSLSPWALEQKLQFSKGMSVKTSQMKKTFSYEHSDTGYHRKYQRQPLRWVGWGLLALLVLVFILWWQGQRLHLPSLQEASPVNLVPTEPSQSVVPGAVPPVEASHSPEVGTAAR